MNLRQFMERYGVAIGVVALLALVIAVLPGNSTGLAAHVGTSGGGKSGTGAGATGTGAGTDGSGGAAFGANGGAGGAGGAGGDGTNGGAGGDSPALSAGDVVFGQGPHCTADGKQAGISYYMPPCVMWTGNDNGGATADGVSRDQVLIVRYIGQEQPGTNAILTGASLADPPDVVKRADEALFDYSNNHYETYGRHVVFQDYNATGQPDNDDASVADAIKIAEDIKPFAVIDGDPSAPASTVFVREVTHRGVLCLCTTSLTDDFYKENPLAVSSGLPTATEYAQMASEYVAKRLAGKPAVNAGDELNPLQHFKTAQRKFGLIYIQGVKQEVDPEAGRAKEQFEQAMAQYGIGFDAEVGYLYDPGNNQVAVTNMIAQLKAKGITTVMELWDPLYPILITTEATRQTYFPEWFIVGTGLSDTTSAGRLYDQNQWKHAFGISPLWVTWADVQHSAGWREYHHARPNDANGSEGVLINIYAARPQTLFRGIQMAGPNLNHDTFLQGLYSYPQTPSDGGHAGLPWVWTSPDHPGEIKDFAEVYYDANASGVDERSKSGKGLVMKTDNGARYTPGQWPTDDPHIGSSPLAFTNDPPGGTDPPHEQDGHTHPPGGCLDCP